MAEDDTDVKTATFKIERRKTATCEACSETFNPNAAGMFEVSPHLREKHGFTAADIAFEITSEVICPPMVFMEARQ